jgi:hypothetical protein
MENSSYYGNVKAIIYFCLCKISTDTIKTFYRNAVTANLFVHERDLGKLFIENHLLSTVQNRLLRKHLST